MSSSTFSCDKCSRVLKSKGGKTLHMKKCNGIDKTTKQQISAQMKDAIWRKMGNVYQSVCPICETMLYLHVILNVGIF